MALLIKCWLAAEIWLASPFTAKWGEQHTSADFLTDIWFFFLGGGVASTVWVCGHTCTHLSSWVFQTNPSIYFEPRVNKQKWRVYRTRLSPSHCLAEESSSLYNTICSTSSHKWKCFSFKKKRCMESSTYTEEKLLADFKVMTKV